MLAHDSLTTRSPDERISSLKKAMAFVTSLDFSIRTAEQLLTG